VDCFVERCGNGRLDASEECDDADGDETNGCRSDCTFTCSGDTDCDDGGLCNGVETCSNPGTASSACLPPAAPATDGTACGSGLICLTGACSASRCGDLFLDPTAGEQCEDGNTVDGDGCDADCTFTCSSAADCSDGQLCNGAEVCGNAGTAMSRCAAGTPATDGTSCGGANICRGGVCTAPGCGDGVRTGSEQCDDGNTTSGDGCDGDCTFTCSSGAHCSDGLLCNGTETCTSPGTTMSRCVAGTAAANGTACDRDADATTRDVCRMATCVASTCGDGFVDPGATPAEQCDDGNTTSGDGCQSNCTWTCTGDATCADTNVCNGAETCTMPSTLASRCVAGTPPAPGSTCDRDGNAATRDICRMASCLASSCGDGFVDSGATPIEQCDDGNALSGDGCSATCQRESTGTPPTAFRLTSLSLVSPRVVVNQVAGCQDITQNCYSVAFLGCQADSVNTQIANAINPMSVTGGTYSLHIVDLFRPLVSPTTATTPLDLHFNAACMEAPTPDSCGPDPLMPDVVPTTANNRASGMACYTPVAAEVNGRRGTTTVTYTPTANTASTPCFISNEQTIRVNLGGIMVPLQRARVSGTYTGGTPATRIVNGVVTGFLSEADAMTVILPDTLPAPLGGAPLYSVLQAGGATGSGCNVGGGGAEDDRDMLPDGTRGFWFFLNYSGDVITWTGL
jgi:cysteine-rich repeat protein